jgi:mRNA interferase MazF
MDTPTIPQLFAEWAKLKLKIHLSKDDSTLYFKERQIWWVSLGQNVGSEENGKHEKFERPVLVLKKFNAEMFLAVPLSSKAKPDQFTIIFEGNGVKFTAILSQIKTISSKRLIRYFDTMKERDCQKIWDRLCGFARKQS